MTLSDTDLSDLSERARAYGIQPEFLLVGGTVREAPPETLKKLLRSFDADRLAPPDSQPQLEAPEGAQCFIPDEGRHWGIALQLYQIRSARNWGIGDFADLEELARVAAPQGASFLGLNPLHALFLSDPARCSPFSPSNRRFLNPLYLAVDRVAGFSPDMADPEALSELRSGALIDYPGVAVAKLAALRAIWRKGATLPEEFVRAGGETLARHALFEAVSAEMVAQGHGAGWLSWPDEWRDAEGPEVRRFAQEHANEIRFHLWLQYLCDQQLHAVRALCDRLGMPIGLYLDFAVGEAAEGSGSWGNPYVLSDLRIGAPPDYFNEQGQDWGLAPLSPVQMAAQRAAPFRSLIEAATRQAGALRIDHAMGLWQLFLIPEGAGATEGTYARYPLGDMLRALSDASQHNRTLIIGEDLGNVPPGFQDVMAACRILSYRIFFFERTKDGFIPPADYPRDALACLSTHDLPTFRGWWRGDDVALRLHFGFISASAAKAQEEARRVERTELLADLVAADLLSAAEAQKATPLDARPALIAAVHRQLARAPSRLFAVRLEDLAGEVNPVNVPSTTDEHPNWQCKLDQPLDRLTASELFRDILAGVTAERPRGAP